MSVDLPAPFSPTSARISPARQSKETFRSAWTPGNALDTPSTASGGAACLLTALRNRRSAEDLLQFLVREIGIGEDAVGEVRTHVVLVVVLGDQLGRDDQLLLDFLTAQQRQGHAQRDHAFPGRLGDQSDIE